jgi:hypothetical protein
VYLVYHALNQVAYLAKHNPSAIDDGVRVGRQLLAIIEQDA